jgi:SsrA-binding protein
VTSRAEKRYSVVQCRKCLQNNVNKKKDDKYPKLLLHKSEIAKIAGKINRQGYTLVPLKMYFKDALIKMEIALCKGKHTYDKKDTLKDRDIKRDLDRTLKSYK